MACDVTYAGQVVEHVGDFVREAVQAGVATLWAGGRLHAYERGGGHLSARHAVNGVVDEYDGDALATVADMYRLGSAYGGKVTVTLVCEDQLFGREAFEGGGNGGSASVCRLGPIYVYVIVSKHRTSHG